MEKWFCVLFVVSACASSPHDATQTPSSDSSEPAPSAEPDSAPTATAAADVPSGDTAPTATPSDPSPYPEDAIQKGKSDAERRCNDLGYKHGCDPKSGDLTLRITVQSDGSVLSIHRVKNALKNDSQAIEQCVFDAVQGFHFEPPGTGASSFTMKIAFDKC